MNEVSVLKIKEDSASGIHYAPNYSSIEFRGGVEFGSGGPIGTAGPTGAPGIKGSPSYGHETTMPSTSLRADLEAASLILSDQFSHELRLHLNIEYGIGIVTVSVICTCDSIKRDLLSVSEPCPHSYMNSVEDMISKLRAMIMCFGLGIQIRQMFNIDDQSV